MTKAVYPILLSYPYITHRVSSCRFLRFKVPFLRCSLGLQSSNFLKKCTLLCSAQGYKDFIFPINHRDPNLLGFILVDGLSVGADGVVSGFFSGDPSASCCRLYHNPFDVEENMYL